MDYTIDTFDWEFYIGECVDLRNAGILTKKKAWKHWRLYGNKENRRNRSIVEGKAERAKAAERAKVVERAKAAELAKVVERAKAAHCHPHPAHCRPHPAQCHPHPAHCTLTNSVCTPLWSWS